METSNLLDTDFKALVIRMFSELGRRIDELSENFNKEKTKMEIENKKEPIRNEEYNSQIENYIRGNKQ